MTQTPPNTPTAYKHYLLTLLMVIYASNYIDRVALGLLLQDIKVDLGLSDTQLGLLSGMAFALFYSVMGIPIARWADRGNRVAIITVTAASWGVAVALCGVATSFVHLLLIRVVVAIGEAGCIPPAHSLIADNFSRAERPRAAARYMLGGPLSVIVSYLLAGWLNELYGWRVTFMMLGLPGVALAVLAWFTLKEPRSATRASERSNISATHPLAVSKTAAGSQVPPSMKEVFAILWSNVTFRHLLLYFSLAYFFGYGMGKWQPTFFIRSHGVQTAELGMLFAVLFGLGGLAAAYLGGELATRYAANDERLQLRVTAIAYCFLGVASTGAYLSSSLYAALAFLAVVNAGFYMTVGPLFATIQTLMPERMRAVAIALIFLFANLIGMGLGPLAAGALSDAFRSWAGEESLRYALLALSPGYVWAAWHLWRGSETVTRDVGLVQAQLERSARDADRPLNVGHQAYGVDPSK